MIFNFIFYYLENVAFIFVVCKLHSHVDMLFFILHCEFVDKPSRYDKIVNCVKGIVIFTLEIKWCEGITTLFKFAFSFFKNISYIELTVLHLG